MTLLKLVIVVSSYPVIPLKPLIHPVKVVSVFSVYVMISSSIFSRPYSSGKPLVDVTVIISSSASIAELRVVLPITTSGTRLSNLIYLSRLSIRSILPP